jgi:hypothetical protein
MAEDLCKLFDECTALDGRLLITRTVYAPAIALELAEIPFGPVSLDSASLHPYVNWSFEQTWSAKEACHGPVRSVLGLAPGETVTLEVRRRQEVQVTDLVRSAMEASEARTQLHGERRQPPASTTAGSDKADELKEASLEKYQAELQEIRMHSANSPFLEFLIAEAIADEVSDSDGGSKTEDEKSDMLADQLAQMHEHENGSGVGTINGDTLASVDDILERIQTSESHHSFSETTTSEQTVTEQSLRRTFSNPYRDRSLELRFIPVFRRFEVSTRLLHSEPGIFLKPGHANFKIRDARPKLADFLRQRVFHPTIAAAGAAEPGEETQVRATKRSLAVTQYLNASAGLHTRRFLRHLEDRGERGTLLTPVLRMLGDDAGSKPKARKTGPRLANAFSWSRARVRSGGVCVPLAALENSLPVFGKAAAKRLGNAIQTTVLDPKWLARWVTSKSVHVFMGTHVEAVAGSCVLADLPPPAQ